MPDLLTRDEARARARLVSDVAYDVHLDLTGQQPTFPSRTTVRFACAEPGASTFVDLDAAHVRSVTLNGHSLGADTVEDGRVHLPDLAADNELTVEADCTYQRTGVGLHRFTDPADDAVYLHTQFEPFDAHRVYACFDQPDVKARFSLRVDAPAGWEVISNREALERPAPGSEGHWRFTETAPMPTYITGLVAGPFHTVRDQHRVGDVDIDLGLYCRASLADYLDPDEIFTVTKQGFDYFTEAFGVAYPFVDDSGRATYDQLFVPEFNFGAMENAGCVTFSEHYVFRSKVTDAARQSRAGTILHELAHMWFGNLVTMRWWDDLWLNESFATYSGTLAVAEATRFVTAWAEFAGREKAWALRQDQLPSTHPIVADIGDTDAVRTNFDGITYAKGASVLKQLVHWVGREAFFAGLRDYFQRHAWGNATLADFLACLERASGRDLAHWSRLWLQTAGVATLRPVLADDDDGRLREVALTQETPDQHPTLRPHRLAVGCYARTDSGGLSRTRRVELDVEGARTDVAELVGEPRPDLLLLNDDDLAFAKVRLDERSIATLLDALGELDDPLARVLCWGAAWDMVRDGELAARRFVTLVAAHAGAETELSTLHGVLSQAEAAIERYSEPANRGAVHATLARSARAELDRAEPGSDTQLVWARTLAGHGHGDADLAWTRGLLDGEVSEPGLAVDTDLRWHLVGVLAARGAAAGELIDAELARDDTDMGARRAAAARASQPIPEAKAQAWQRLLADDDLPLASRRAIASGFHQVGQETLLEPFVERFPEALPGIWEGRMIEESLALTAAVYPQAVVEETTVAAADRALADETLPAPGRRVIIEHRDATLRALRARATDAAVGAHG